MQSMEKKPVVNPENQVNENIEEEKRERAE